LSFYVNFYEKLMFFNSIFNDFGLVIRIDNVSHIIDYMQDGIFVPAGSHTFMSLNRQYKSSLPKPYSECEDLSSNNFNSDLYNLIANSKYAYTQQYCLLQCFQTLAINLCNCSLSYIDSLRNVRVCASSSEFDCVFNDVFRSAALNSSFFQVICMPQCPLECNSSKITYSSTSTQLNTNMFMNVLQSNPNLSSDFMSRSLNDQSVILQSVARLNIYYDSLSYTITEESAQMDISSLVSQIGGNLGLFMGVCLFSLGEIVITFIEILLLKLKTNTKVNS